MNSHLNIEVNGKPLALGEDFSIDLDFNNPMFNDADSYSYPVEIPLDGNRHLVQNIEDKRSTLRPVSIDGTRARLYADGLPVFDGHLVSSDGEELIETLSLNIEGNASLRDIIADLDCRDIPLVNPRDPRLKIGHKLDTATFHIEGTDFVQGWCSAGPRDVDYFELREHLNGDVQFSPQALGFSTTENNNIDVPYPNALFCKSRIAYKHYGKEEEDGREKTSDSIEEGEYGPYFVLEPGREQSGICFFVLYFLDCLFSYLGLYWDNSKLVEIEDMKRLCFFTTKCKYSLVNKQSSPLEEGRGSVESTQVQTYLNTLSEWHTGIRLEAVDRSDQKDYFVIEKGLTLYFNLRIRYPTANRYRNATVGLYKTFTETTTINKGYQVRGWDINWNWAFSFPEYGGIDPNNENHRNYVITRIKESLSDMPGYDSENLYNTPLRLDFTEVNKTAQDVVCTSNSYSHGDMYANSDNFPEASVSTIIESLENQFGIRFLYDADLKTVKAVLLRDMYRSTSKPHLFHGEVHSMNKMAERITGVRIGYSAESDAKEQRNNLRDNIKDYDTNYDYVDYPEPGSRGQTGIVKACNTIIDRRYRDIYYNAYNTDNNCYIDTYTGNAYRVKVDSEANDPNELRPAWFEVGMFKSAEFGDCSKKNEDNIIELMSSFEPLIPSDVSRRQPGRTRSFLVPFADCDMEHEWIEQNLKYALGGSIGKAVYLRAILHLRENYDVSSSNEGNSPLQDLDWGLTIAIMRGSWSATGGFAVYDSNYDGFGNGKYRSVMSDYSLASDSLDPFGNEWDYDGGTGSTTGRGEHFSLKPRAYKTPSWAPDGIYDGTPLCRADEYSEDEKTWHYFRNRGYVDRFLYEHARFLIDRRKFIIRATCTPAMIMDIKNHWQDRWRINDEIGYINKVSATIDKNEGIGEAIIEFYAI